MAAINKKSIIATMLVYGISRGVVDEIKPASGEESVATDTTVFNETMKALQKGVSYGK